MGNAHLWSSPEFEILAEQMQNLVKVESASRPGPKTGNRKLLRNLESMASLNNAETSRACSRQLASDQNGDQFCIANNPSKYEVFNHGAWIEMPLSR